MVFKKQILIISLIGYRYKKKQHIHAEKVRLYHKRERQIINVFLSSQFALLGGSFILLISKGISFPKHTFCISLYGRITVCHFQSFFRPNAVLWILFNSYKVTI